MKQRNHFRLPRRGRGFLGENNLDGLTDEIFSSGALERCRNLHIVGRGRLLKREGDKPYNTEQISGSNPVQGLGVHDFDAAPLLLGLSNGSLKTTTGTASWTDKTGALSLTGGADVLTRIKRFHDGTNGFLMGANDTDNPWYFDGSSDAAALDITAAADLGQLKRHVFAINTSDRVTAIRYSKPGVLSASGDFPTNNIFDCTRDSAGVALAEHGEETLLAFHQNSVHRINFNYGQSGALASFFVNQPVDTTRGASSRTSVVSYKGRTYFASDDGFYSIGSVERPANYISRTQEGFWNTLNRSRIQYITGFARGEPWNEIVWLVSTGTSTQHNAVMVYNPVIAGLYGEENAWTIFDSSGGFLKWNTGVNWIDSNKVHRTILGGYTGKINEAWGSRDAGNTTGYLDDEQAAVETELQTGFLDLGYEGIKGLREIWMDLDLKDDRVFNVQVDSTDDIPSLAVSESVGTAAALIDDDFIVDESYLVAGGVTQAAIPAKGNHRYFRLRVTENDQGIPHAYNSFIFLYKPRGMRIK